MYVLKEVKYENKILFQSQERFYWYFIYGKKEVKQDKRSLKSSSRQSDLKTEKRERKRDCLTDGNHNQISLTDCLTLTD